MSTASAIAVLSYLIKKLKGDLVGDHKSQQRQVASTGEDPEQSGAIEMGSLARERLQCVGTQLRVWDIGGTTSPDTYLARYGLQAPEQLSSRCDDQRPELAGTQGGGIVGWGTCPKAGYSLMLEDTAGLRQGDPPARQLAGRRRSRWPLRESACA